MKWQPISTALRDEGEPILLHNVLWGMAFGEIQIGYWNSGQWDFDSEMSLELEGNEMQPTHWMPPPDPPDEPA